MQILNNLLPKMNTSKYLSLIAVFTDQSFISMAVFYKWTQILEFPPRWGQAEQAYIAYLILEAYNNNNNNNNNNNTKQYLQEKFFQGGKNLNPFDSLWRA